MPKIDNWVSYEERHSEWLKKIIKLKELKEKGYPVYIYPSPPDERDFKLKNITLAPTPLKNNKLPFKISLHLSPLVLDQEDTPFCAGFSLAGAYNSHYDYYENMPPEGFSGAFAYWISKKYDGIPDEEGTYLRTVLKIGQRYGLCRESLLPLKNAKIKPKITQEMLEDASKYKIKRYAKLDTLEEIKEALSNGYYVIMGKLVFSESWENPPDGFLSLPRGFVYGGHGTYGWGYDDKLKGKDEFTFEEFIGYLLAMNSWSEKWGENGAYKMPYDYYYWILKDFPVRAFLEAWLVEFQFIGENKPPQPQPDAEPDNPADPIPDPIPPDYPHIVYIVQKDDTMYSIAQKFEITLQKLLDANPHIEDKNKIYPGDILYIPKQDKDENGSDKKKNIFIRIWKFIVKLFTKILGRER